MFGAMASMTASALAASQPWPKPIPPKRDPTALKPVVETFLILERLAIERGRVVTGVRMNHKMYHTLCVQTGSFYRPPTPGEKVIALGYPLTLDRDTILKVETKEWIPPKRRRCSSVPRLSAGSTSSQPASPPTAS